MIARINKEENIWTYDKTFTVKPVSSSHPCNLIKVTFIERLPLNIEVHFIKHFPFYQTKRRRFIIYNTTFILEYTNQENKIKIFTLDPMRHISCFIGQ